MSLVSAVDEFQASFSTRAPFTYEMIVYTVCCSQVSLPPTVLEETVSTLVKRVSDDEQRVVLLRVLREVATTTHVFAGVPRAIVGAAAVRSCAKELGLLDSLAVDAPAGRVAGTTSDMMNRGWDAFERVYGPTSHLVRTVLRRASPSLERIVLVSAYGMTLAHEGSEDAPFSLLERELCAVVALRTVLAPPQLKSHIAGASRVGATAAEITSALAIAQQAEVWATANQELTQEVVQNHLKQLNVEEIISEQ